MRTANNIRLRVFRKEWERKEDIDTGLRRLLPFDIEKEKIKVNEIAATGFEEKKITVITATLDKERYVRKFLENLMEKLGSEKETLLEQVGSRLDDDLNFFIRLDEEMLAKGKYVLTDSGNCYHIRINLAAFPKKREKGIEAGELPRVSLAAARSTRGVAT